MNDWYSFFHHVPHNLDAGTYRLFQPQCKAEILHWFGREDIPKEQKEAFVWALINFDDGCGGFYRYRAYFLAGEALAHFKDCSLGDEIVRQLLKWSYVYFQEKPDWKKFPQPLGETARATLKVTDKERVITAFERLLYTTESRSTLQHAAVQLGRLDPGNKTAIAALGHLLQVSQDNFVWQICSNLAEIDPGNETAIAKLIYLIETKQNWFAYKEIDFLKQIGFGSQSAMAALVHLDKNICRDALNILGRIGLGNQTVISALVRFLQVNQGDAICLVAATALWQIDPGNVAVIGTLVQLLETTQDLRLLYSVAKSLATFNPGNREAIAVLSERLETTPDEYLRFLFAASLLQLAPGNKAAIANIVHLLEIKPQCLHWEMNFLGEIGSINEPAIIATVIHIMETTLDKNICHHAIDTLGQIGSGNDLAIAALTKFLQINQGDRICFAASEALLQIAPGNEAASAALSYILETNRDDWLRLQAAGGLVQRGDPNQKALYSLLFRLVLLFTPIYLHEYLPTVTSWWERMLTKMDKAVLNEAIATVIQLIKTFREDENKSKVSYESCLLDITDGLKEVLPSEHLPQVVIALKTYLGEEVFKNPSYRYEAAYNLIWYCAQNMPYPDFYKAWHS